MAAAVTFAVDTTSTLNVTSYTSGAFTPAANDLLVIFVHASGTVATQPKLTDSQGLGATLVGQVYSRATVDTSYVYISNALAANSSMTVTFDCTDDAATGCVITVYRVSGMTLTGLNALRQVATVANHAAGTPAPSFGSNCLTTNPTFGQISNATSPALTAGHPPTSWTEGSNSGYATPTTGQETVWRNSGFTGTTVTWGTSSASAYAALIIELNAASIPTVALNSPSNAGTVATLTPQVEFTGSDGSSNNITYEVEVDTTSSFNTNIATPAWVQSAVGAGTSGSTTATFGSNTTSGNLIVVTTADDSFSTQGSILSVTDNKGNTYYRIGNAGQETNGVSGQDNLNMYYAYNIVGGASHVITVTSNLNNSSNVAIAVQEFSGFGVDDPLDKTAVSSGASTTPSSGNTATLSQAAELVVAGFAMDTAQTPTLGSGYSNLSQDSSAVTVVAQVAMESKAVNATTAVAGTLTITSTNWAARVATFKANTTALITHFSKTDAGFADITTPANTDPFVAGDEIGYTMQSNLTNNTTYYWRARGMTPTNGSKIWGNYPSTFSFLVSTGGVTVNSNFLALM